MMIFDVEHLERLGWLERIRFTLPYSKKRALKERGPMDRATIHRIVRDTDFGLALLLGKDAAGLRLMVLDKDGDDQGPFASLTSPMTATTDRGEHLFFLTDMDGTNKIKVNGLEVDLLWNATVPIPPTATPTGMPRRWRLGLPRIGDLPLFPSALLKEEKREAPPVTTYREIPDDKKMEALRRWIGFKFAESGSGGDAVTFKVAVKIVSVVKDFNTAMAEILRWDRTNALPPWSDRPEGVRALEHKIRCAITYLTK